jgi:predicted nicotinamide N-methyase
VPALVAAARGAHVTATDWASDAVELLQTNAERNGLQLRVERRDWSDVWDERFDLALAADVLYEQRNVEPLVRLLPGLAGETLLGLAGRPYEAELLARLHSEPIAERVVRLRNPTP